MSGRQYIVSTENSRIFLLWPLLVLWSFLGGPTGFLTSLPPSPPSRGEGRLYVRWNGRMYITLLTDVFAVGASDTQRILNVMRCADPEICG
jgi:hypothetical protein